MAQDGDMEFTVERINVKVIGICTEGLYHTTYRDKDRTQSADQKFSNRIDSSDVSRYSF